MVHWRNVYICNSNLLNIQWKWQSLCSHWTECLTRLVFKRFLQTVVSNGTEVTFCGRVLNSWEAVTRKAWLLMVETCVHQTTSDDDEVGQRRWKESTSDNWWNLQRVMAESSGLSLCSHLTALWRYINFVLLLLLLLLLLYTPGWLAWTRSAPLAPSCNIKMPKYASFLILWVHFRIKPKK